MCQAAIFILARGVCIYITLLFRGEALCLTLFFLLLDFYLFIFFAVCIPGYKAVLQDLFGRGIAWKVEIQKKNNCWVPGSGCSGCRGWRCAWCEMLNSRNVQLALEK